jgi:tetratricopeptide (TPR) repeat protein
MKKIKFSLLLISLVNVSFGQSEEDFIKIGFANILSKDYEASIILFTKAIEIDSSDFAFYGRGLAKFSTGKYPSAIVDFSKAIEINPKFGLNVYYYRARCKLILNDAIGSIPDFNKSIIMDPNNAELYYFRGLALFTENFRNSKNDFKSSLNDFNKAIKMNPKKGEYYTSRGSLYIVLGKINNARLDFSKGGELGDEKAYEQIKQFFPIN